MQLKAQNSKLRTLLAVVVAMAVVLPAIGRAQEGQPNRAGLVIRHGDGRVVTACVQFGEPSISGTELLDRAGVSYVAQTGGTGAAVCKLDGEGCDYPTEDCFCHCKGAECVYWAYQRLREGRWRYSPLGAKSTTVHPGDVDGWAWGTGTLQAGAQPPVLSFEQVCAASAPGPATEAPPPTQAAAPPTAPATAIPTPRPRPTRTPSARATAPARTEAPAAAQSSPSAAPPAQAPVTAEARPTGTAAATGGPAPSSPLPAATPAATIGAAGAAPTGAAANYLAFGALALLLAGGITAAALRRRAGRPPR